MSAAYLGCGSIPEGRFACTTTEDCPSGWFCHADDGRCHARSEDGGIDSGPPRDASIDSSIDAGSCDDALTGFDSQNCGSCGSACMPTEYCASGTCRSGAPIAPELWPLFAGGTAPGVSFVDVVGRDDEECVAINWTGEITLPGVSAFIATMQDAAFYCRRSMLSSYQGTPGNDTAQSLTLLGNGVVFGGISNDVDGFLRYDGDRSWVAVIPAGTGPTRVTGMDTDELGRAYAGGQVYGSAFLPAVLDPGAVPRGNPTSGADGFVMRIPPEASVIDTYLSVDDRASGMATQIVHRVAARADVLALCGSFFGQIDAEIEPVVTAATDENAFVALYDLAARAPIWTRAFGGTGAQICQGVDIDGRGRVYAAIHYDTTIVGNGVSEVTVDPEDIDTLIAAFEPGGALRWSERISPTPGVQRITDLRVDELGNTYVVGLSNGPLSLPGVAPPPLVDGDTGFIASLDPQRAFRWAQIVAVMAAGSSDFVILQGIDFVDRTGGRAVLVAGTMRGNLVSPSGSSVSTPNSAGILLVFEE